MRLSVKGKEVLGITLLTCLVVAIATILHLSQLTTVILEEAIKQASLIKKQIFDQSKRALIGAQVGHGPEILRNNEELQQFLEASVGYSQHLVYALIVDTKGTTILSSDRQKRERQHPVRQNLEQLVSLGPIEQFQVLYKEGAIFDSRLPMTLKETPIGEVVVGVHTSLLRDSVSASLKTSLTFAALALPFAWLLAMGLATLTLRPIRGLAYQMEQLRKGDFDVLTDLGRTDEYRELAAQLQLLGKQLQSDRLKTLSEQPDIMGVVDHLENGVMFVDHDRRILYGNTAVEGIFEKSIKEIQGCPFDNLGVASQALMPLIEEVFKKKDSIRNTPCALPRKGIPKPFDVSILSLLDGRKLLGVLVILKDLESIKTLHSLIAYAAKLTSLGQLTSGLAHEVKNPLNSMVIHLELLKDQIAYAGEEASNSLNTIESDIRRLDRVVQGFLKFMRPQELQLTSVDVHQLLTNEVMLLEVEWKRKGIRFNLKFDPNLPIITADQDLLRQVFLNIVLNACQAMPDGGTVTIKTKRLEDTALQITISDQGCGIAPEHQDKIFNLYYTTKPDGSGMGLAMAYRIVQLHDGTLTVLSEPDGGAAFVIQLPIGR